MNIKELKKIIKNLPDDCEVYVDMANANDSTDIKCVIYSKIDNCLNLIIEADIRRC